MIKTFGQLKVRHPDRPNDTPTVLTFVDGTAQWDTARELERLGYEILDEFGGYKLFRKSSDAIETAIAILGEVTR